MKKLVSLLAILAFCGISSAGMITNDCDAITAWNPDGNGWDGWGTFNTSIVADGPSGTCIQATSTTGGATLSWVLNDQWQVSAGDKLTINWKATGPDFKINMYIDGTNYIIRDYAWGTGNWEVTEFIVPASGTVWAVDFNYYAAGHTCYLDSLSLEGATVPEPATFAILGLGGLFFRRRRACN